VHSNSTDGLGPADGQTQSGSKQPQKKTKEIILNGMAYDRVALVCNILVLGGIRSGKTSGTFGLATDQLLKVFNDRDDEIGGFFLDVKGNRTTRVLKFAHDAGRDVVKSCKIIRPNCALPYVKLADEETGFLFHVPAVEFSTGSEAARLLAGAIDKPPGNRSRPTCFPGAGPNRALRTRPERPGVRRDRQGCEV